MFLFAAAYNQKRVMQVLRLLQDAHKTLPIVLVRKAAKQCLSPLLQVTLSSDRTSSDLALFPGDFTTMQDISPANSHDTSLGGLPRFEDDS
jgi:hypothetical protein